MSTDNLDQRQAEAIVRAGSGDQTMREGKSWGDFLAGFRLRGITDSGREMWAVESASGDTYTVHRQVKMDELGSYYNSWSCTCPARKQCRHIDAIEAMLAAELLAHED